MPTDTTRHSPSVLLETSIFVPGPRRGVEGLPRSPSPTSLDLPSDNYDSVVGPPGPSWFPRVGCRSLESVVMVRRFLGPAGLPVPIEGRGTGPSPSEPPKPRHVPSVTRDMSRSSSRGFRVETVLG